MLAVTRTSCSSIVNGSARQLPTLVASVAAAMGSLASICKIANSSPPKRATRSVGLTVFLSRSTTCRQESVAKRVAERIVDVFEIIEIDEKDGERARAAPAGGE